MYLTVADTRRSHVTVQVYSYHEFLGSLVHDDPMTRMTDEEWSQVASDDGTQATLPEWTAGFLP